MTAYEGVGFGLRPLCMGCWGYWVTRVIDFFTSCIKG